MDMAVLLLLLLFAALHLQFTYTELGKRHH